MYVIYDIETGVVDRILRCPRNQVHMNVFEGQAFVELEDQTVIDDPANSYVLNGDLVRISSGPPHHDWDWATKSWLPNLDAARESQRQAWNAWRDRELVAGYSHNGHVFHSDDRFMAELQLILKGYEREYLTGTSAIRTRDNGTLQMTHLEIEGLLLLIGLHRQAIYAQSWAGKDALVVMNTLESIMVGGPPE